MPLSATEHRKTDASDIEDIYPLTPLQQGMLFHALYEEQSGVDIEQLVFRIHADLDVDAFEAAWRRVVDRHPILRTSFRWDGLVEPLQRVHANGKVNFYSEDWRLLNCDQQQHRLEKYLKIDRERGFDLKQKSLTRVALFQLGASEFCFVWSFHHILLDGRSFIHVLAQVNQFHKMITRGLRFELPVPRSFREHIESFKQIDIVKAEHS